MVKNKPYVSWEQVKNNLNITPEQELEIQFEKDIIKITIEARKSCTEPKKLDSFRLSTKQLGSELCIEQGSFLLICS